VLEQARATAVSAGVSNVEFVVGSAYDLRGVLEASGPFDIVHAHQVLLHLADPVAGLREMLRATRPAGVLAARDADYESGTSWGRSCGQRLSVGGVGELGVPAVEVVGELVVEDTGADLQQQVGAAG